MSKKVALLLVERSDFQELLRADAEKAARRVGLTVETFFSGEEFASQLRQIRECIDSSSPPDAMIILPVRDRGFVLSIRAALRAGISFVCIGRTEESLSGALKEAKNGALVSHMCPDEVETGRIQGRQFRALLPQGGRVLYIEGGQRSLTYCDRARGMREVVAGSTLDVTPVEAGASFEEARAAVRHRLALLGRIRSQVDLIGCQTDQIAQGAIAALDEAAAELQQPELARIPVTGCDATPSLGQRLVQSGRMVASINLPRVAGQAVEILAKHFRGDAMAPAIFFKPTSYPPEEMLRPLARRGAHPVSLGGPPTIIPT